MSSENGAIETRSKTPWLSIVGIGLGGWHELGAPARQALLDAELIVGGERHLAMLPGEVVGARTAWPQPFTAGLSMILAYRGHPVVVLATGDPFWFGAGASLSRLVTATEIQAWPQPSAFSLAAARLGWTLQYVDCLSVHGRALTDVVPALADRARLLVLSWDGSTPAALARLLTERGFGASQLTVVSHLGGADETRTSARADAWPAGDTPDLNVVGVDCVAAPTTRVLGRSPGRAEDWFTDCGQITKREIRAIVIGLLAPATGETLWDIGAGSGAIGIEWLLADARNQATAVEIRADRAAAIESKAAALGAGRLRLRTGAAAEVVADLDEVPEAIFIGGGLTTPGLVDTCMARLGPRGRLVATSVTLEGEAILLAAHARWGGTLRHVAIARSAPLGTFTGWQAQRPIVIWSSQAEEAVK